MLEQICRLSRQAGSAIMAVYQGQQPLDMAIKQDASPVTAADLAAHQIIKQGLAALTPTIPLLSEEDPPAWEVRRHWQRYWLVDPLDGTKEFLKHNDEFTVNIALIDEGEPVMAVVYAPALDCLYAAYQGQAWKEQQGQRQQIRVCHAEPPCVLVSRSHPDQQLQHYLQQLGQHQTLSVGSSLKFCLLAEGKAQLYPRFGAIHIWDTAAGHAVVQAAGARFEDWQGNPLDYTPRESLLNPGFRVFLAEQ
ncbi:3'(2'),5'-bisphosphate nucleotidase CysQ [Serratia microhaemolytica]|uniref:3'(2'),5'-bisphosphate nucleotidase CysQ n=1 Tax=Serratia microhaemolytica TaxID=2675110 RepID=UPI000FDD3DDC|nr:3'(2'),5'-bisphosphate nucleotidase CysQ [Serratia microhaemolytica]